MEMTREAIEYLNTFSVKVKLTASYQKSARVKECYKWCEANMGAKYKDWYMMGNTIHFKDSKRVTMFRLVWFDLIAD